MPLVYIHGVRQRNKPGLERLQGLLVGVMQEVGKHCSKVGKDFEVRVPYWGEHGVRTDGVAILPATLSQRARAELQHASAEDLGFDQAKVPEDDLQDTTAPSPGLEGRVPMFEAGPPTANRDALAVLRGASRDDPRFVQNLVRELAREGLGKQEAARAAAYDKLPVALAIGEHAVHGVMHDARAR